MVVEKLMGVVPRGADSSTTAGGMEIGNDFGGGVNCFFGGGVRIGVVEDLMC